ncbi:saccharopine dehydrogenase family protein [Eilatimonas milleporae]|uniref:Short subunit dehydrogenase-like uncharacterized protein n=1 Tax=Eilatimonas milleporae TaxID=911205 RepID=A0A3M0CW46_9PROT|nr:saccharopine dehydrogenase NADP-binding domain-containing protein [Eilatimonas milleporae]RMB13045.1 short subunit dehydrogenase-like uncharacterized protein [Eilatimonas milleporae]
MKKPILLYGATGYTGRLIARTAKTRGVTLRLAGRNAEKLRVLSQETGFDWTAFPVSDGATISRALEASALLLSAAGPFSATAAPLMDACIAAGISYLDITGEIDVFETAAGRDAPARQAGITIMPGVGFDVVPSDCLAKHISDRVKTPVRLVLGVKGLGMPSRGTGKTAVETLKTGVRIRKNGVLTTVRPGSLVRDLDYGLGDGAERHVAVPWGDVSTAFRSTGIGDIEVYFPATGPVMALARLGHWLGPLPGLPPVQRFLKAQIDKRPEGPGAEALAVDNATLMALVTDADGTVVKSRLETPNGYTLTADASLKATAAILQNPVPGYQTPATAFGGGFLDQLEGCRLTDL